MEQKLLLEFTIKGYPREIELSKAKRAKYYKGTDKLASKYLQLEPTYDDNIKYPKLAKNKEGEKAYLKNQYTWKQKASGKNVFLFDTITKEFIIKNPSQVGKPSYLIIRGQDFYNNVLHKNVKNKIVTVLHEFWENYIKSTSSFDIQEDFLEYWRIKEYPVRIEYEFTCNIDDLSDIDNYCFIYKKTFQDSLVRLGLLSNDRHFQVNEIREKVISIHDLTQDRNKWGQSCVDTLRVKIYQNT